MKVFCPDVSVLDFSNGEYVIPVTFTKEEVNLLHFVGKVHKMSFCSYVEGVFKSIYDIASLSVYLIGMTLDEAIDDWNDSKVVQDHPELFVHKV